MPLSIREWNGDKYFDFTLALCVGTPGSSPGIVVCPDSQADKILNRKLTGPSRTYDAYPLLVDGHLAGDPLPSDRRGRACDIRLSEAKEAGGRSRWAGAERCPNFSL